MNHYTYKIVHALDGRYYIGVRSSKKDPLVDPYMGSSSTHRKEMKKGFPWEKFILSTHETRYEADENEVNLIKQHLDDPLCINRVAWGPKAMKHSEATKRKISEAKRGVKFAEEHKANIRKNHARLATNLGKPVSEETRNKISETLTGVPQLNRRGRKRTPEQCARISAGTKKAMTPEICKMVSERTKEAMAQPEVREKYLEGLKNRGKDGNNP